MGLMSEQDNDRFDAFLRDAARDYHTPPSTPRDEMWSAVVAGRRARSAQLVARRRWMRWAVGVAAVLALGIAIGRVSVPQSRPNQQLAVTSGVAGPAATYRAVAGDHLGRVETLLAMFQIEARSGRPGEHVSTTARNLLTTNRLLLDSPVATTDPEMRQLLEDLDLVLAQIAQLSVERGLDPSDLIVRALEDNGVLMRLRSAVPAGPMTGTQGAL
jgi:hypothetical protein